jgi:hypothetical protein
MAYRFFTCRFRRVSTYNTYNTHRYFVSVNLRVSDVCVLPSTRSFYIFVFPAVNYLRFLRFFASKNARNISCRRVFVFGSVVALYFSNPQLTSWTSTVVLHLIDPSLKRIQHAKSLLVLYSTSPTKTGMSCECIRRLFRCCRQELSALSGWPGIQCAKKIFAIRDASTAF